MQSTHPQETTALDHGSVAASDPACYDDDAFDPVDREPWKIDVYTKLNLT